MTDSLIEKTRSTFIEKFGYSPAGVWSAPGRVNLIGEHTDYNEGFVFPFAINRHTYAAVGVRDDATIRVSSGFSEDIHQVQLSEISKQNKYDWAAYPIGVAWAIQQIAKVPGHGFDCHIESDVPVGAGLSSSAAIECSVGVALNDLWKVNLSKQQLAKAGQLAENEIVGAPTGIMDQSASLLGETDHGVFLDCKSLESQVVNLGFARDGLELLIIDTKVAHRHADGGYSARRASCENGASLMGVASLRDLSTEDLQRAEDVLDEVTFRRVKHVITENQRVLDTVENLKRSGPRAIGHQMHESHISMRDDFEISIDELDVAVETAIQHGAIGARMTGGGFGGAAIALVPIEKIGAVTLAIKAEFENLKYQDPEIFAVSAGPGAHRVA